MKVSVIIINYNTFRLTSDCIRSVMAHTRNLSYEIILVDNASTECAADDFLREFPSIKLVKSAVNGGFAAGNNAGIRNATGDLFLLLNSDTILTEDSIGLSVKCFQQHPGTGVLGCKMVFPDGGLQYTARRFRSISWELLDLFRFIPYLMSYPKRSARMLGKYFKHERDISCDWLNGAFFLFPRTVLEKLPGQQLDERFFMYGEDQLWCEQIARLGHPSYFYAGTTITHINSGSTGIGKQLRLRKIMMKHELEIMRERKGRGLYYFVFKLIYTTKEGSRNFIKTIVFRLTGKLVR
jgi:GT2 family glycosyltransferase